LTRITAGAFTLGVLALGGSSTGRYATERARIEAAAESTQEAAVRDADIAFFTARAARDLYGAGDRARLASLLLARARATGRYEDLVSAEESARASLKLRRGRNRGGTLVLTNALMGQHRFREALVQAEQLELDDSTVTIASLRTDPRAAAAMTTRRGASPASARRQPTSRLRCASRGVRSPAM
jgi:hypothetical protein